MLNKNAIVELKTIITFYFKNKISPEDIVVKLPHDRTQNN